jgi:hypothetical protein
VDNNGETAYHAAVRLAATSTSCMSSSYDTTEVWPRVLKALAARYVYYVASSCVVVVVKACYY